MGLSSALATAMSGLRANQIALSIVSSNVANAQTPGYVTQSVDQIEVASGDAGASVRVSGVNRQLDLYIQNQLRTETSGGAYADQIVEYSRPAAKRLWHAGRRRHPRNVVQQFYQRRCRRYRRVRAPSPRRFRRCRQRKRWRSS